jgi:hypothetical protein
VLAEEAATLAALGVTWLTVYLPAPSRAAFLENVARFGAEVILIDYKLFKLYGCPLDAREAAHHC